MNCTNLIKISSLSTELVANRIKSSTSFSQLEISIEPNFESKLKRFYEKKYFVKKLPLLNRVAEIRQTQQSQQKNMF